MRVVLPVAISVALVTVLQACAPTTVVTTPTGFVALDEDDRRRGERFRAVSADGAVVVVRSQDNETFGTLEFWQEAMVRELTELAGYELVEAVPVSPRAGPEGMLIRVRGTTGADESVNHYDVAVFVVEDEVVTVEMAAPEAIYDDRRPDFDMVLGSLEL